MEELQQCGRGFGISSGMVQVGLVFLAIRGRCKPSLLLQQLPQMHNS